MEFSLKTAEVVGAAKIVKEIFTAGLKQVKPHIIKEYRAIDEFYHPEKYGYHKVKITKDLRLDDLTSRPGYEFMKDVHISEMMPAESINTQIKKWFDRPPFMDNTKVPVFEADGAKVFSRVYNANEQKFFGQFFMLKEDIQGLTAMQLKTKFDLPFMPTHISEAIPPQGTKIAMGIVKEGNFGGQGLGTQFYSMGKVKDTWFKKIGEIKND